MLLQIPEPEAGDVEPPKENAAGMWDLSLEYSVTAIFVLFCFRKEQMYHYNYAFNAKEPTKSTQLQMTMRDMWVNHHQVIWKNQRERLLVDQVVLEALAVTLARPLVVNVPLFCRYYNKKIFFIKVRFGSIYT